MKRRKCGGASLPEASAFVAFIRDNTDAKVLMSAAIKDSKNIEMQRPSRLQIDLLPTIAALLGVPTPAKSCGALDVDAYQFMVDALIPESCTWIPAMKAARANALGLLRMVKVFQPDFDMPVSLQNLSWAILDEDSYDDGVCARAKATCKRIESEAKLAQSIMRDHLSIAPSETVDAASFAGVLLQVVAIFACASYLMVVQRRAKIKRKSASTIFI